MSINPSRERALTCQVVPRMLEVPCGVKDYALLLTGSLLEQGGGESVFLSAGAVVIDRGADTLAMKRLDEKVLSKCYEEFGSNAPSSMILQFSGYGYSRRGAPVWLARAIEFFRHRHSRIPWITMFHEVAATGSPMTSAFWMRPLQLHVARRLMKVSDVVLTNCEANARVLTNLKCQRMSPAVIPVFSNLGEPDRHVPMADRERQIIVFSSNLGASQPSSEFWRNLTEAVGQVEAQGVTIIGRPVVVPEGLHFPVTQTGFLEADDVSVLLSKAAFGYVFHGPLLLGKSGIFAALAAHGVTPLVQTPLLRLPDGLTAGRHYHPLMMANLGSSISSLAEMGANLREWYRPHSLAETGRFFVSLIERVVRAAPSYE